MSHITSTSVRAADRSGPRAGLRICIAAITAFAGIHSAFAFPLSAATRARVARGEATSVVVEYDVSATDRDAAAERTRRRIDRDDAAILTLRTQGYRRTKTAVEGAITAPDATLALDYAHFGLSVWNVRSAAALERLQSHPFVRRIHENASYRAVSVSDLPFIHQPQVAAQGAIGAGTTIAVIDGGLGTNYLNFSDFGTCTGVNTPASTCRVVYNHDYHTSSETLHGTNVSAIALGVAPGAKLAMFNVFNGSGASLVDLLNAMNTAISLRSTYNIVALNLSLGDGTSHSTQCTDSAFATPIADALDAGILTVVAAGNNGSKTGLADPACVPDAVSVGAVYDASYGSFSWVAPSAPGGSCTDTSAPDKVTCFSQSAGYLSLLAPGTFVNAPSSAFQESGTSQATPHVSGAVAVLRARYPSEPLSQTVTRMKISGIADVDPGNSGSYPRLDLLAAVQQGTAVSLTGSGTSNATAGSNSTYVLTVSNGGPLQATNVRITNALPAGATFVSASAGCTFASGVVTCLAATLASGAHVTFNIIVRWNVTGPIYDSASVTLDQTNTAPAGQQLIAFGSDSPGADAPLPTWTYVMLALLLFATITRRFPAPAAFDPASTPRCRPPAETRTRSGPRRRAAASR